MLKMGNHCACILLHVYSYVHIKYSKNSDFKHWYIKNMFHFPMTFLHTLVHIHIYVKQKEKRKRQKIFPFPCSLFKWPQWINLGWSRRGEPVSLSRPLSWVTVTQLTYHDYLCIIPSGRGKKRTLVTTYTRK